MKGIRQMGSRDGLRELLDYVKLFLWDKIRIKSLNSAHLQFCT